MKKSPVIIVDRRAWEHAVQLIRLCARGTYDGAYDDCENWDVFVKRLATKWEQEHIRE